MAVFFVADCCLEELAVELRCPLVATPGFLLLRFAFAAGLESLEGGRCFVAVLESLEGGRCLTG